MDERSCVTDHDQNLHLPRGPLLHEVHCAVCSTDSKCTHPVQHQHPPSHTQPHPQALPQAVGGSRPPVDARATWHRLYSQQHPSRSPNHTHREPTGHDGESVLISLAARGDGKFALADEGLHDHSRVRKERLLHHIREEHLASLPFGGNGAYSVTPSNNDIPPTPLQQCDPRSLPTTNDAPPQLSTRPDSNHVSLWEAMVDQAMTWLPGHAEPLNDAGESPLMAFAARWNGTYYCFVPAEGEFCGYHHEKEINMVSHIRDEHLDQRPWRCDGQCANSLW
jgi:hypothetical protein